MPSVTAPEGEAARSVRVHVLVRADGGAEIAECDAGEAVCAAIAAALEGARFTPARSEGVAVAARVGLLVELVEPAPPAPVEAPPEPPSEPPSEPPGPPAPSEPVLGVTAEIARREGWSRQIAAEEARETPGALGDPFRAVLTMPGVLPVLDGMPYFYLRGAPPSGTRYYYDGIQLPVLYHFAGGPAVVHPRMLGDLSIHGGIAPARYGDHNGGVVTAEPPPRPEHAIGEAEVRLLDLNGYAYVPYDRGSVAVAARIGYPGLIASLISPDLGIQYYDYQARARHDIGSGSSIELVALGSIDRFEVYGQIAPDPADPTTERGLLARLTLDFHRAELRYLYRRDGHMLLTALRVGYDESSLFTQNQAQGVAATAATFGPRFDYEHRHPGLRIRAGGSLFGTVGGLSAAIDGLDLPSELLPPPGSDGTVTSALQRTVGALYAELEAELVRDFHVDLGLRAGAWLLRPGTFEGALDPRLRVRWDVAPGWTLHAAAGVARQPATFFFPLPGLSDLPLDLGLQTTAQSELGVGMRHRIDDVELEGDVRLFLNRFEGLLFGDILFGSRVGCTQEGLCRTIDVSYRSNGWSYGGELWVKAGFGRHFATRLAYTVAEATSEALAPDVPYTPTYDVRHVWTLVLGWDSQDGWTAGLTGFLRSGASDGYVYADEQLALGRYEQRLPWFGRVDASVAYAWDAGWARLRVSLDFRNATFALGGEPLALQCNPDPTMVPEPPRGPPDAPCGVDRLPPIAAGTIGIRGSFR